MSDGVILDDIKKLLGIDKEYDVFDTDILIGINTTFSTLQQLGVGPRDSFSIEDKSEKWSAFFNGVPESKNLGAVKTYIFMRVKLMFDPPTTSFALDAYKKQIEELEWRLSVQAEGITYVKRP